MKYGFGIDLGGTTVKIAYFDENGTMLEKWEIPTVTAEGGKQILPDSLSLMEIKTDGAMPIWLAEALGNCKIYPGKFSKYATAYRDIMQQGV